MMLLLIPSSAAGSVFNFAAAECVRGREPFRRLAGAGSGRRPTLGRAGVAPALIDSR